MKDLVVIFKILNVCADRVEDHPVYVEPMMDLLKLCGFPFLKERSSDETSYEQIAAESVSQLGMKLIIIVIDIPNWYVLLSLTSVSNYIIIIKHI